MDRLADTLVSQESINEAVWQWEYLEERNAEFKRRLRPILRTVSFEALGSENPCWKQPTFCNLSFVMANLCVGMSSNELTVQFVPDRNHRYLYTVDARAKGNFPLIATSSWFIVPCAMPLKQVMFSAATVFVIAVLRMTYWMMHAGKRKKNLSLTRD